ncbi:hypothetical protein ACFLZX_04805 [Nanoarchaeota archaeon]
MNRKNIVPLSGTFMIAGLLGAAISIYLTNSGGSLSLPLSWGMAFTIVFVMMIIASLISMTYAPTEFVGKRKKLF